MESVEQRTVSLEAAQHCLAAGWAKATELGIAVSIAVVDAGASLKAFSRMERALLVSVESAWRKAYSAAAAGRPTQEIYEAYRGEPALLGQIGGLGPVAFIPGGLPLLEGEDLIGAVGVGGGTPEQDVQVAEAAVAALGAAQ